MQTLSRLNRTYAAGGKGAPYVLDFVNEPAEILEAFKPYYREASLTETTDPDLVHDLQAKLDGAGIYTEEEVEAFITAYLVEQSNSASSAPLKSAAGRFNTRYTSAVERDDKASLEELDLFRKDLGSFVRLYDFLSQIVDYEDTDLEKRSLFLRLLAGRLQDPARAEAVDLSAVELTHIKQTRRDPQTLDLHHGPTPALAPVTAAGSGVARDPNLVLLEEVLAKINDLFAGEDFSDVKQRSWVEGVMDQMGADETLAAQADANTTKQFLESPDLSDAVTGAVLSNQDNDNRIAELFFANPRAQVEMVRLLGRLFHQTVRAQAG